MPNKHANLTYFNRKLKIRHEENKMVLYIHHKTTY